MRVGSRGEFLKKNYIDREGRGRRRTGTKQYDGLRTVPHGSYLKKIRIRLVLFKSYPEDCLIAKYQNPSKSSGLLSLLAIIS